MTTPATAASTAGEAPRVHHFGWRGCEHPGVAKVMPFYGELLHLPATLCLSIGVSQRGVEEGHDGAGERTLAASPRHTFADLAIAIDEAFGRWELGDRRWFTLADGSRVGDVADAARRARQLVDYRRSRLHRLQGGERFSYTFDAGQRWHYDCVLIGSVDPSEMLADRPGHPVVYQSCSGAARQPSR